MITDMTARITHEEYRTLPGLNFSGLKHLAVSPLRYWYHCVNPDRPADEPTPQMRFGSAVHCAVLEPDEFGKRYARSVMPEDYEHCLVTIDDLRTWLRSVNAQPKGTRKDDLIAQVQAIAPDWPIWDVIRAQFAEEAKDKVCFDAEDWDRIKAAAAALRNEPQLQSLLSIGQAEVTLCRTDPDTDVLLKGRLDWMTDGEIIDVKTFSQMKGKTIDRSIADAIYHEKYYQQAVFYSMLRGWPRDWKGSFIFAFVESEAPFEVRLRSFTPRAFGETNLLWERGRIEIQVLIRQYARCVEHFGERPWRSEQCLDQLTDEEFPQLVFGR